jgi:predicted dehydrogenase
MGRRYAEILAALEGVRLTAVADSRQDLAHGVAAATGAAVLPSAQALAAANDVDAVFVCTPEDAHVDAAVAAIELGKPVMIEKPVAHTMEAAERIRSAAKASRTLVMVGHILRFEPRWAAGKRLIASGAIGDVVSIATRRVGNLADQQVLKGRTTIPLYYGVHDLDIVRWFSDAEPVSIQAARRSGILRAAGYDTDDLYCAIIRLDNDAIATAELGWHIPPSAASAPSAGITVVGSDGWLRIEQGQTGLECYSGAADRTSRFAVDVSFWPEVQGRVSGALVTELEHFLACVRTDQPPAITLGDAIEALRLSLAMERAAATGTTVELASFGDRRVA